MATQQAASWSARHTIPSDTSIGSALINDLIEAMVEREWPALELFHVQLSFEEAIINAIVHGNGRAEDKTVEVEMTCDADLVCIQITDQGGGFNPGDVPDPRQDELLEVPGGRGLLLMHEIMSEVKHNESGNQITLKKIRGDNPPDEEEDEDEEK